MTEYKFGTWYPIKTLSKVKPAIICTNSHHIMIGEIDPDGELWDDSGSYTVDIRPPNVVFWMPLPPRPGEE